MRRGTFAGLAVRLAAIIMLVAGCIDTSGITPAKQDAPMATPPTAVTPSSEVVSRDEVERLVPPLPGHTAAVTQLVFSRDGKMLVSGSDDGFVILWDVRDPAAPARLGRPLGDGGSRVRSLALSPDGRILVVSTSTGTPPPMHLYVWDVSDPEAPVLLGEPLPPAGRFVVMYALAFSPDDRVLAIGSENRTITLWDMTAPATPVLLGAPLVGHEFGVQQVAFSPDGTVLASGDAQGAIRLWSMSDPAAPGELFAINEHEGAGFALDFSPDGKFLAADGEDGVHLWFVAGAEDLAVLDVSSGEADGTEVSLDFSPDGSRLATSSGREILLWDVSDPEAPARTAALHSMQDVNSIAFSADGKTLATGGSEGAVILWHVSEATRAAPPAAPPAPTPALPVAWPVSPLTEQQIASVNECAIESLTNERYPDGTPTDDLRSVFAPQSDCDWAVLALAYAARLDGDEPLPEAAKDAFSQAVSRNFGFALATPLFYYYFGSTSLVETPPAAQQEITDISIKYNWVGLGDPVKYALTVRQANTAPVLTVTPEISPSLHTDVDRQLLQALAPALTDLLPVGSGFTLSPCTDNYIDWDVTLTFADSTTIHLTTDSNFLYFGGPWFTAMDDQTYIQLSPAFPRALYELVSALGLPIGEPAGMTCFGDSVFDKAFP